MPAPNEHLINHLSKEIDLANNQLIEQRSKNNLFVAFGPFLILWGVVSNDEALKGFRLIDGKVLTIIASLSVVAYILLGVLAAEIEMGIWRRANSCRETLATHLGLKPDSFVHPTRGLYKMYGLIFGALGIVFVGLGYLCYRV